ncbi:MAG: protein O-mannosyl-transferase family [Planctomycetota bacterium]
MAALLLVVYLLTMAPTLSWSHYGADGGDLVRAVARGSIPHPPGFPTYLLLGDLFIRLPLRNPAWRLNLMSGVAAAGAAGLVASTVQRLQLRLPRVSALCAGLALGLAPLFWSQALITEVYTLAAFCGAVVVLLVLHGAPEWMRGIVWGLGLGVHPTLMFLVPVVFCDAFKETGWSARIGTVARVGLAALPGWGAMVGPVLLARNGAASPWADVRTLDGWWGLVSGRLYRGYVFALPLAAWPPRILAWAGLLARQFTPAGALLAGIGWLALWRERRGLAASSLASFGGFGIYALGYDTADSLVYLVPALPLAGLWLGLGVDRAVDWLQERLTRAGREAAGRCSPALALLIPLFQALLFWGGMDLSGDRAAMAWAGRTLEEAPPDAVLLTRSDAHTFTLWYACDVLGRGPDVVVIDRDLWFQEPYRGQIAAQLELGTVGPSLSAEEAARRAGRPVVSATE